MNNAVVFTVGIITGIVVTGYVTSQKPQSTVSGPIQERRYDAVRTCQTLAATTTREDWHYKDCIDQFKAALDAGKVKAL